jgi:hypothetical protein
MRGFSMHTLVDGIRCDCSLSRSNRYSFSSKNSNTVCTYGMVQKEHSRCGIFNRLCHCSLHHHVVCKSSIVVDNEGITMAPPPLDAKRRRSDHAVTKKAPSQVDHEQQQHPRRKTMGASPANFTPSKNHLVNIPAGASAYYFGGTPHKKTPAKSPFPAAAELDETVNMNDTSILSAGTSSSEESDMLNKSVLSDTTELTASNFVLQASSRQLLLELAHSELSGKKEPEAENVAPQNTENTMTADAEETSKTSSNGRDSISSLESVKTSNVSVVGGTPARPSPSLRARLGESPSSLKKLTSSLRKEKQQNEQEATHRLASRKSSGGGGVSFMLPSLSPTTQKQQQSEDTTVEIETDKPLDDLLNNLKEPTSDEQPKDAATVSSQVAQGDPTSPSTISSTSSQVRLPGTPNASSLSNLRQSTPHPMKDGTSMDVDAEDDDTFTSPTSTKADEGSNFRISSGGSRKKLTPTKLSQSPQRVLNPESMDSPARNTRSASKRTHTNPTATKSPSATNSPARNTRSATKKASNSPTAKSPSVTKVINSNDEQAAGTKRGRSDTQEQEDEIGVASLSIRAGNPGRLSELTLSPSFSKLKRRRSSMAVPPTAPADDSESVHSTSTASTTDLNNLLEPLRPPTKETVEGAPAAGMRSVQPSPATADISVPRSILTSSRRSVPGSHQSRKSVVFGSPEAAEYRIGSPSVSLTPMPKGTAKAMFTMPSAQGSQSSSSTASEGLSGSLLEDETVEIENALMQNVAASESKMRDSEAKAPPAESEDMDTSDASSTKADVPPLGQPDEDETVELETNIEGLFSSTFGSPQDASMLQSAEKNDTTAMETSPAESVDMTDAQSIASMASSRSGKSEDLKGSSQKLDFEGKLSESPDGDDDDKPAGTFGTARDDQSLITVPLENEEENTIELEADLTSLLAASGGAAAMTREAPKPVTLTKKFPKMDSNLVPRTNRLSFGDALLGNENVNHQDDTMTDGSLTKELETNMESLIKATGGGGANTPSASRRRSSHRFSLTPGSRTTLSEDGTLTSEDLNAMEVETSGEGDTDGATRASENEDASSEQEQADILELTSKEVMESAGLPTSPSALQISDILANANSNSESFRNPLIADAMAGFVFAVCGEVEMKAESSSDGDSCFDAIAEQSQSQLLQLQKALRSSDALTAARGKEELKRLAQSAKAFVEFEWHSWEVQVVDSLAKALDGIVGEFEESDERLMSSVTLADDALEAVSLMEGRAVQKARRQSMARRKVCTQLSDSL